MRNKPSLDVNKVNSCAKSDQIALIYSQDIELKQNSEDNQGP